MDYAMMLRAALWLSRVVDPRRCETRPTYFLRVFYFAGHPTLVGGISHASGAALRTIKSKARTDPSTRHRGFVAEYCNPYVIA
jgi:hypothetical protein